MGRWAIGACALCIASVAWAAEKGGQGPRWTPGENARPALEALWAAAPFGLAPTTLAQASGGVVPTDDAREVLLVERFARVDAAGRVSERYRSVWRVLTDNPNQTIAFTWAPWFEEKPKVRARVVSPDGQETWLDPSSAIEGGVSNRGLILSDVRELKVALPNVRRGAVVELETEDVEHKPYIEGAGTNRRWTLYDNERVRKWRYVVEAPESTPIRFEVVGTKAPTPATSNGITRVAVESDFIDFNMYPLTLAEMRAKAPRFAWSTAKSWEEVARRYRPSLDEAFSDNIDLASLQPFLADAKTVSEKAQAVMRWSAERVRYTALHLGDGAIVPTLPSVVLKRGYGDCKDLATLVAVALRKIGVAADVALIMADGPIPSDQIAGPRSFNHMIVAVPTENGRLWVDATVPEFPVGVLPGAIRDQKALIASAATTGLSPVTTRQETKGLTRRIYSLLLAEYAQGAGQVTVEQEGANAGYWRSRFRECDAEAARTAAKGAVNAYFGDDEPFISALKGCKPGDSAFVAVADVAQTDRLFTDMLDATVRFPVGPILLSVPTRLIGEKPGSDDRSEAKKANDRQRTLEKTGRTEEELKKIAVSFSALERTEVVFRVHRPRHFVDQEFPPDRSLVMGPSTWTESYKTVDASTTEVRFTWQLNKVDWPVSDVEAFREAFWKRMGERTSSIEVTFEPTKQIIDRHPRGAGQSMAQWLAAEPKEGVTRARFARQLSHLGLIEQAKREAERALKDLPDDPLALVVRADLARRDPYGSAYEIPFERADALRDFRKARQLLPRQTWIASSLAETLRRNEDGDVETQWTPDMKEAATLLKSMVDRGEASGANAQTLVSIYEAARRFDELKALAKERPDLTWETQLVSKYLMGDVPAALRQIEQIVDIDNRVGTFRRVWATLLEFERWADAAAFADGFKINDKNAEAELRELRALNKGSKPIPAGKLPRSTAEEAMRALFAAGSVGLTPRLLAQRVSEFATSAFKPEILPYSPERFFWMREKGSADQLFLFHLGRCTTSKGTVASRVYCEIPDRPNLNATAFWIQEAGTFRLVSLGHLEQMERLAWSAAAAGKTAEAADWIDWILDKARQQGDNLHNLQTYWEQADRGDPEDVRVGAALAVTWVPDDKTIPPEALVTLAKGSADLTGSLRRTIGLWLTERYFEREEFKSAIEALRPIAISENEPPMLRRLALLEGQYGDRAAAWARIDAALKKRPTDFSWRETKASLLLIQNQAAEAMAILQQLQLEKGGKDSELLGKILWCKLLLGQLDESSERDAEQVSGRSAAMAWLERDQLVPAYNALSRIVRDKDEEDAVWLYRGRALQKLGYLEDARAAFSKMSEKDADLVALRKRFLQEAPVPVASESVATAPGLVAKPR